ncbi:MAG: hypothetical protein RhofKO_43430 [Rhodothermales bacterium]
MIFTVVLAAASLLALPANAQSPLNQVSPLDRVLTQADVDAFTTRHVAPLLSNRVCPSPGTIFVDADAGGANDGTSWTNAYIDLQDALYCAIDGDEVWIAEGTYYPVAPGDPDDIDEYERIESFVIPSGVALYGGFAGTEGAVTDRSGGATILSGDIDHASASGSDLPFDPTVDRDVDTDTPMAIDHVRGDNSYTVVFAEDVAEGTLIDGVDITGGVSDGYDIIDAIGGGLLHGAVNPSTLTLRNVRMYGNAAFEGGGAANVSVSDVATLIIDQSDFFSNVAYQGGAILSTTPIFGVAVTHGSQAAKHTTVSSPTAHSELQLSNSTVRNNYTSDSGGGVSVQSAFGTAHAAIVNTVVSGNESGLDGGGLLIDDDGGTTYATLTNTLVYGNTADDDGGGLHIDSSGGGGIPVLSRTTSGNGITVSGTVAVHIRNSIIWGNTAGDEAPQIDVEAELDLDYSLIEGGCAALNGSPLCGANNLDETGLSNADFFTDAASEDFTPASPSTVLADAGDNTADLDGPLDGIDTIADVPFDLAGNARIQNTTIDVGPYESTPVVVVTSDPDISVSPSTLRFPDTAVSESSAPLTVTATNTGTGLLTISSITLNQNAGTSAGFQFDLTDCGMPLAANESCDIAVTFAPLSEGYNGGSFVVETGTVLPAWKRTVYMGGTGLPSTDVPILSAPASLSFPDTPKLQPSAAQALTLKNTGTQPLIITTFELAWGNSSAFVVTSETCTAAPIAPDATCTANLTFTPQYVGTNTASLRILSNAGNDPVQVALSGTGVDGPPLGRILTLSPQGGLYFPATPVGTTAQEFVILRSEGTEAVTLAGNAVTGSDADVFNIDGTTCTGTLASQTSCTITIGFTPTDDRYFTATLEVTTGDGTETLRLGGSGSPNAALDPALTFDPVLTDQHFGTREPGEQVQQDYIITNTGGSEAIISSATLAGDAAFTLTTDCGTLAPSATCTLSVTLDVPDTNPAWWYGTQLTLTANTQQVHYGAHFSAAVNANNVPPADPMLTLKVDGSEANGVIPFDGGGAKTLVLSNEGDASSSITLSSLTLQDWPFTFFIDGANTTCTAGLALAGGESCDIALTYTASAVAWQNGPGALRLHFDDDPWFAELSLVPPATPVLLASSSFLVAAPNTTSQARVTINNPSAEAVALGMPTLAGAMPDAFKLTSACPATLAAGATCALSLDYMPGGDVTSAQAMLSVQVGDETRPRTLTLRGRATGATSVSTEETTELALTTRLNAYPNPAQHQVNLAYTLPDAGHVRLSLFDVLGREVAVSIDGVKAAGVHQAVVALHDLPTGTYIARLKTDRETQTRVLTVTR